MGVKIAYFDDVIIALLKWGLPKELTENVTDFVGYWCSPKRVGKRIHTPSQIIGREMKEFFRLTECKKHRLYLSDRAAGMFIDLDKMTPVMECKTQACSRLTKRGLAKLRKGEKLGARDTDWTDRIPVGNSRWLPLWVFIIDYTQSVIGMVRLNGLFEMVYGDCGNRFYKFSHRGWKNVCKPPYEHRRQRVINFFDAPEMSQFQEFMILSSDYVAVS